MKFLIAFSVLASSSLFAAVPGSSIKCYEAPQQTGSQPVTFKFSVTGERIALVHPSAVQLSQIASGSEESGGWECLQSVVSLGALTVCQAEGQHINGLVPVDIGEETTYCQPAILDWISGIPGPLKAE